MAGWKKVLGVATVVMALAGACSSVDDGSPTSGSSDQTTPSGEPVKVGVTLIDFEALRAVNVKTDWGDQELVWQTLIDAINADGGVAGHQIEPSFQKYNTIDAASAEAACVALTEDQGVSAVLFGFTGPAAPSNACFADAGVAQFTTNPDDARAAEVPWVSAEAKESRRLELWADLLVDQDTLEGKTFGVIAFQEAQGIVEQKLLPPLEEAGYVPAEVFYQAPGTDFAATQAAYDVWAERISSEGIDHVILVDDALSGAAYLRQRGYTDELSTEWAFPPGNGAPKEEYPPLIGMSDNTIDSWSSPAMQECVETFEAANPDIEVVDPLQVPADGENWGVAIRWACTYLDLFQKTIEAAGGVGNAELLDAVTNKMPEFSFGPHPYGSFGPDKYDANDGFRIVEFDPALGVNGGYVAVTELVDVGAGTTG